MLSDALAQKLTTSGKLNWRRTLVLGLYGLVWAGPMAHWWQQALERMFPNKDDPMRPAKKVLLDQLSYGPVQNFIFLSFMARVVEGRDTADTLNILRVRYPAVQFKAWKVRMEGVWGRASDAGVSADDACGKKTTSATRTLLRFLQFAPVVQYVNQMYVPLHLRVLWLNAFSVVWGTFMIFSSRVVKG
ncbi:hypothetical protein H632_c837p0 [Helicosporidium sp. ATCC 50920]|nr:hypothetical protein H632_c837p0 [Helicosporidium sp. ATCC 50920]|eukprot:KDD75157.1 hypothetical protein H632_c837p0 [Helicosporidium sp. ATCC 50920]